MKGNLIKFLALLFLNGALLLAEEDPFNKLDEIGNESVAFAEGLPSNIVNGTVCVITGEYTDQVLDIALAAPEPLIFSRTYSSEAERGTFKHGWSCNHREELTTYIGKREGKEAWCILRRSPSGALLNFSRTYVPKLEKQPNVAFDLIYPRGMTNGASEISGRHNIKNIKFNYKRGKNEFDSTDGAGVIKNYKWRRADNDYPIYYQTSEIRPSGLKIGYKKNPERDLYIDDIEFKNNTTGKNYGFFKFEIPTNQFPSLRLIASDERTIDYKFKRHEYQSKLKAVDHHLTLDNIVFYLEEVHPSHGPKEKYDYEKNSMNDLLRIKKKSWEKGRYLSTSYYQRKDNEIGGKIGKIQIKDKHDFRIDRVKRQKAPVGHGDKPIVTHTFVYNEKGKKGPEDDSTEVYDAYWHKTLYAFNDEQRLKRITKYIGISKYLPVYCEEFYWGKDKSSSEGNLLAKYLIHLDSNVVYTGFNYQYDEFGNITEKTTYGKLTGKPSPLMTLKKGKIGEKRAEKEVKTYRYSNDGLNLLTGKTDSNGTTTTYVYYPSSGLLKAKYLNYQNKNQLREFYHYNEDGVLVKKVVDNAPGMDEIDWTYVNERHITYYTPRTTQPVGLYESVEEKYYDFTTQQEVLLKKTQFTYTKEGWLRLQEVYDANNTFCYAIEKEYNTHGKVIRESDPLGQWVERKYDSNDNLIEENWPSQNKIVKNTYDYSNRLVKQEEHHSDGTCYVIKNNYNYLGQRIASTNAYGHETVYEYDDLGRLTTTTYPAVPNEEGILVNPVVKTEYDIAGFPIAMTDARGQTTLIENTIRGKPFHITYPDKTEEWFFYQLDGQLAEQVARDGTKKTYKRDGQGRVVLESFYDNKGQLIKSTEKSYNGFHLLSEKDSTGPLLEYEYDWAGRLSKTHLDHQLIQQLYYDPLGRIGEIRDWYGTLPDEYRKTVKSYDRLNRLIDERIELADGSLLQHNSYKYDPQGNKEWVQLGDQITQTKYNSQGNPIEIRDGEGNTTFISYLTDFKNKDGQTVLQTVTTDPLGYQTLHTYDTANRLVQTTLKNPFGGIVSDQELFYDLSGNRILVIDHLIDEGKHKGEILTHYSYTMDNQVEFITEAKGTPEQKTTAYRYNHYGQKSEKIKADGVHLIYDYDAIGRLKHLSSSDRSIDYQYDYNLQNKLTKVVDNKTTMTTEREYNICGQLLSEKLGSGLKMGYVNDLFDRSTQVLLPDKTAIEYVYNGCYLKEIHRIVGGQRVYSHVNANHNLAGLVTKAQLPLQGGKVAYQYDRLNRTRSISHDLYHQLVPEGGYDPKGNLLTCWTNGKESTYQYDDLHQIRSENGAIETSYRYDSLSNRLAKNGIDHEHNALHQLLKRGTERYVYDINGNLTQKIKGGETVTYRYDALDRLTEIRANETLVANYSYDSFHRRLVKKQPGKDDILFVYQGEEEIGSWQNGQMKELKILNQSQRHSVAVELDQQLFIPIQDLHGNIASLLDKNGKVVESYTYTVFGETQIHPSDSSVNNPWQYANKRLDKETGLVFFGLRYYDADLGRWISPDPAGFEDGANPYAYVHNNPLKFYDLMGLFTELPGYSFQPSGIQHASIENEFASFHQFDYVPTSILDTWQTTDWAYEAPIFQEFTTSYNLNDLANPKTGQPYNLPQFQDKGIGYICGIGNSVADFKESLGYLGELCHHNITGVHNASFGFGADVATYLAGRGNYAMEGVKELHKNWDAFFKNNSPKAIYYQICHSRGAVVTRNALMDYPEELRGRIMVLAIAPGAFIDPKLCHTVTHLISNKDIIPALNITGRVKHHQTVEELYPHPFETLSASFYMDHGLNSRTYKTRIRDHATNYLTARL